MFGWNKTHTVTRMVNEYLEKAEQCLRLFKMAFETRISKGDSAAFEELAEKTHFAESACDDIRRRVETELYAKALIPESRGDVLRLLEKLDKIPNKADHILSEVSAQLLLIPADVSEIFKHMLHLNCECFDLLVKAVRALFLSPHEVKALSDAIDKKESAADRREREAVRAIFSSTSIAPDQKILLKDLVRQLNRISDRSENVADLLNILQVKRLI